MAPNPFVGQMGSEETDWDDVKYQWQAQLREALLELDAERLKARVVAAEAAILARLEVISGNSGRDPERQAIADALATLRVLKRDEPESAGPKY